MNRKAHNSSDFSDIEIMCCALNILYVVAWKNIYFESKYNLRQFAPKFLC